MNRSKRRFLRTTLVGTSVAAGLFSVGLRAPAAAECVGPFWPLWDQCVRHFMAPDGRIVDVSIPEMHSTSESQSYCMFFALVANDRLAFDRIWQWAVDNLMGGDVSSGLPAWRWGRASDGTWGVLDPNAASDADLWFVYALLEAARLWGEPAYERDARVLLRRIVAEEVIERPGLGPLLLPGPVGFALENDVWRLNPSYMPLPVLRRLEQADPAGPWAGMARTTMRMFAESTPHGLIADWVAYQGTGQARGHFAVDPVHGDVGSYDAIRCYMWAGMTPPEDPLARPMLRSLSGMARLTAAQGTPPESVATTTGVAKGQSNYGFWAAMVPYLRAMNANPLADALRQRTLDRLAQDASPVPPSPPNYYDYMLSLFALGFTEQQYRFLPSGKLQPRWENTCRRDAYQR